MRKESGVSLKLPSGVLLFSLILPTLPPPPHSTQNERLIEGKISSQYPYYLKVGAWGRRGDYLSRLITLLWPLGQVLFLILQWNFALYPPHLLVIRPPCYQDYILYTGPVDMTNLLLQPGFCGPTLVILMDSTAMQFFSYFCFKRRLCPDISFFQIATKYPNKEVIAGK